MEAQIKDKSMKLEFIKIKEVKHSGNSHIEVMKQFEDSFEQGSYYCSLRGWRVEFYNGLLTVYSILPFGFKFVALCKSIT